MFCLLHYVKLYYVVLKPTQRRNLGVGEDISPPFFWKLLKNALILEKKVQIMCIHGLNLPFAMPF